MLMILLEPRTLDRGYFVADGVRKLMDDHLHRGPHHDRTPVAAC